MNVPARGPARRRDRANLYPVPALRERPTDRAGEGLWAAGDGVLGQGGGEVAGQKVNTRPYLPEGRPGLEFFRPGKFLQGIVEAAVQDRGPGSRNVVIPSRSEEHTSELQSL